VTGGTRGIGAETVRLLGEEGATALAVSRSEGIDVTALDAAEQILERLGGRAPDILVNNAGTSYAKPLGDLSEEDWQLQWDLNVMASMRLMRAFVPQMAERGWGRVVNVTSSAGKRPSLTNAAYAVGKAAQMSLSRVFADTYGGQGVLVNSVAPGAVASELWTAEGGLADQTAAARGISREEAIEVQEAKVPIGRFGTPEEIANVVVFLCSERAADVTGANWSVDGGTVATIV
jgi:3-oxoacyl-[acyl-carrier protein] reductase